MSDLYDVLGLGSDATQAEIRSAYRKAAKRLHPDAGGGRAEFERLQEAYTVLSDATARAKYDRTGTHGSEEDVDAKARDMVTSLAKQLAELDGAERRDLVKAMDIELRHAKVTTEQHRADFLRSAKQSEKVAARFARKKGHNFVSIALRNTAKAKYAAADGATAHIEKLERAIAILQEFTFTPEAPPPSTFRTNTATSGTASLFAEVKPW